MTITSSLETKIEVHGASQITLEANQLSDSANKSDQNLILNSFNVY